MFWSLASEAARQVTPESLGQYLTWLVVEKNGRYPEDDAPLFACGMLATVIALAKTCQHPVDLSAELQTLDRFIHQQTRPMS